jgi:hypothetical protein
VRRPSRSTWHGSRRSQLLPAAVDQLDPVAIWMLVIIDFLF